MSGFRFYSRWWLVVGALALGACAQGDGAPQSTSGDAFGTVQLALSSAELGDAERLELTFTPANAPSGPAAIADAFQIGEGLSVVSRNYRLPVGAYQVAARALDAAGTPLLRGHAQIAVHAGSNTATIPLTPAGEDLGDVLIGFTTPRTSIAFVAADGDTNEGGRLDVSVGLKATDDTSALPVLRVEATIETFGQSFVPLPSIGFELAPVPGNPLLFRGSAPSDWLGVADLRIEVFEGGAPSDSTMKEIIGHPSPETELQVEAIVGALTIRDDGTLAPIDDANSGGLKLTPEGVTRVNDAIERFNQAVRAGQLTVAGDFSNVAPALVYCSRGYWWCVAKILKCELYTAGCIAAAPAAAAGCGSVCVGTIGVGCVACIIAAAAGTVSICEDAYDCWVEASREGCL